MVVMVWWVLVGWCCVTYSRPNIVILLADDLGYHDVSWHNSQVLMPNLHNLAQAGIILDQHYSQATCAPSRGALLTGRYPVNIQMNPRQFKPTTPFGLPTKYPTMAEMLKSEGYVTHAVGKYSLENPSNTPICENCMKPVGIFGNNISKCLYLCNQSSDLYEI